MIKVEAPTLQEAYSKAASELSCSVVDLEINVLQNGSSGFLGMFKKSAIIEVERKNNKSKENRDSNYRDNNSNRDKRDFIPTAKNVEQHDENVVVSEERKSEKSRRNKNRRNKNKNRDFVKSSEGLDNVVEKKQEPVEIKKVEKKEVFVPKVEIKQEIASPKPLPKEMKQSNAPSQIDQNFHHEKREISEVIDEIRVQVQNLFKYSCFAVSSPVVTKYNEDTILIEFSGEDAALLIGKEGYRYKALSYLLYNWINIKYGLNIRLEIAEFLKNQEEMIEKYLIPVIERIRNSGRGQTRILDGVLIKIALEALRAEFPEKYVGIKSGKEGGKFIVVNDFNRKNS